MRLPFAAHVACLVLLTQSVAAQPGEAPRRRFELENGALVLPSPISFDGDTSTPSAESAAALAHVKAYLDETPSVTLVRVEGHVDASSSASQKLSEARALAVAKALVKAGVDCKRLFPVGFGSTKPVAPNDTAQNRGRNRRVVFANAALRGQWIGGMPPNGGGRLAGDPCSAN